jgi:8-amino-7-oxononanoate synthase
MIRKLSQLIDRFKKNLQIFPRNIVLDSMTQIQGIIVKGNDNVCKIAQILNMKHKLDIRPIRFPSVPKNKERLRICLHSHNTIAQVDRLCEAIKTIQMENIAKL